MITQEYKYRVLYADTDAMGVVYHGNYMRLYEAARGDFLDKIETPLSKIGAAGIITPIIKININYLLPIKFDWTVKIITKVEKKPLVRFIFNQEIYSPDEILLNKAEITSAFVDANTFKAIRCPEWILNNLEKYDNKTTL